MSSQSLTTPSVAHSIKSTHSFHAIAGVEYDRREKDVEKDLRVKRRLLLVILSTRRIARPYRTSIVVSELLGDVIKAQMNVLRYVLGGEQGHIGRHELNGALVGLGKAVAYDDAKDGAVEDGQARFVDVGHALVFEDPNGDDDANEQEGEDEQVGGIDNVVVPFTAVLAELQRELVISVSAARRHISST